MEEAHTSLARVRIHMSVSCTGPKRNVRISSIMGTLERITLKISCHTLRRGIACHRRFRIVEAEHAFVKVWQWILTAHDYLFVAVRQESQQEPPVETKTGAQAVLDFVAYDPHKVLKRPKVR